MSESGTVVNTIHIDKARISECFRADRYATELTGIEIVDISEDYAKTKLVVEPKHMNAFGIIQGGVLFTLADFTFAVAINAEQINAGQDDRTVAIECHISFLKPVTEGILYAEARLVSKSRSLVAQDVTITNERGETIAKFHGRGFTRQPR